MSPIKTRAHAAVNYAVYKGRLKRPDNCEECGTVPQNILQGHHEDYSKPLNVEWLCGPCHAKRHPNRFGRKQ